MIQIPNVFINVSKGQAASTQDLAKAFGPDMSRDDIILEILDKGELQVGEKERTAQLDRIRKEVIDIVATKLIDPRTKRVYTTGMIEKALDQLTSPSASASNSNAASSGAKNSASAGTSDGTEPAPALPQWTGLSTTRSAKSQALEAMKALIAHQPIPLIRARMRIRITCPTSILKQSAKSMASKVTDTDAAEAKQTGTVKDKILDFVEQIETQDTAGDEWEMVGFVEPGSFKPLSDFLSTQTKGRAQSEILDMAVKYDQDAE